MIVNKTRGFVQCWNMSLVPTHANLDTRGGIDQIDDCDPPTPFACRISGPPPPKTARVPIHPCHPSLSTPVFIFPLFYWCFVVVWLFFWVLRVLNCVDYVRKSCCATGGIPVCWCDYCVICRFWVDFGSKISMGRAI